MARRKTETCKTGWMQKGGYIVHLGDDEERELAAIAKAQEMGLIGTVAKPDQPDMSSGMRFSELYAKFLAHKMDAEEAKKERRKPLSERMQKEYARYFKTLVEIMGEDMPIYKITRKVMKDAILTFRSLPQRNKKPYMSLPVLELLEMEIPEKDLLADNTVSDVKKLVQGIFSYGYEKELITASPARDLKLNLDLKQTFAMYSDAEVKKLLAASFKESEPWRQWLPTLAAHTGARMGELVQLRKQDIKPDTDTDRHYILITGEAGSVKSDNADRQVPLHSALIDQGFLDFVDKADGRLFDSLNSPTVTKWFAKHRDSLDIERFDDLGNRKVFHSFRHTFITKSEGASNSVNHVQQVTGHKKTSFGVTDRYIHPHPLKVVLGVVDRIEYK